MLLSTVGRGGSYRFLLPASEAARAQELVDRTARLAGARAAAENLSFYGMAVDAMPWWLQVLVYDPSDVRRRVAFMYDLWDRGAPASLTHNYSVPPERTARLVDEFADLCTEARRLPIRPAV